MYPELNFPPLNYDKKSEFMKYEFSLSKKKYDEINDNEYIKMPKTKNLFNSDLSGLESKYSIFDSGLKKLGMFIHKQKLKEKEIFELIDERREEILNSNQFTSGCQKIGLLSRNYLNNDELKEIFKTMDINNNNVVTLDEFLNFLKKYDFPSILNNIKNEMKFKAKNSFINAIEAEKFLMLSNDNKIKIIEEKINEINKFYDDINKINDEDIVNKLEPITNVIYKNDLTDKFKVGIIFLDEFKKFLYDNGVDIEEKDVNDIFAFFDRKNKNNFIFVRDIIGYLKENEDKESSSNTNNNNLTDKKNVDSKNTNKNKQQSDINKKVLNVKLTKDKYILIWIGIMKKLIKFCLINLNISPNEFTEKFILIKESRNAILSLNFIQTRLVIDKLGQKITNFLPIEKKILFEFYLDYYKYGILFKEDIKPLLDDLMVIIQNKFSEIDDFDFNDFDSLNGNEYVSASSKNLENNLGNLQPIKMKELLPIFNIPFLEFIYHSTKKSNLNNLNKLYEHLCQIGKGKDFLSEKEFILVLKEILPIEIYNTKFVGSLFDYLSETIVLLNEPKMRVVTIQRLIMLVIHMVKQKEITNTIINHEQIYYADQNKIFQNFDSSITKLKQYDAIGNEIKNLSSQYYSLIKEAIFSGMIILSKKQEIDISKKI